MPAHPKRGHGRACSLAQQPASPGKLVRVPTYVALLRGINVGGNRIIKMTDLKAMFEAAGASDVATYIQSGNVVFKHPSRSAAKLASQLEKALGLTIILRTADEMQAVLENNPFPPESTHVFFLRTPGGKIDLDPKPFLPEKWQVVGRELYVFLPNGIGRSQLVGKLMRKPPVTDATARNWRTCEKLTAMCRTV
jgi:uncharacterized protein (DUF1697 family)